MAITTRSRRAVGMLEKGILGVTAGAAAAVGIVDTVFFVMRVAGLGSGPVELTGVPTSGPQSAGFAGATFDSVTLTVAELSAGGRAFLMGAAALSWLLVIGICATLAWLSLRVFLGKPFGAVATWGIGGVAILVFFAGIGGPFLHGMAVQRAVLGLGIEQVPTFLVEVDLAPLGWALVLAVVAGAFEIGGRLQRETEGLV